MPGIPCVADTSSIPGSAVPAGYCGDAVAAGIVTGAAAAQLCGTDNVPTRFARPISAETADPPMPDEPSEPIAEPTWPNPTVPAADGGVTPEPTWPD